MTTTLEQLYQSNTPLSQFPEGMTAGYQEKSEQQVLNELADETDIQFIDADEFLSRIIVPDAMQLPQTLHTLDWWKVFNQGPIGSCFGCSDCQTATGVHWLQTGERVEFSKFGHYILTQWVGGMLGRDVGSVPSDGLKVAAKIGYCPEVWSEHLETVYQAKYNEPSGFSPGQQMAPAYPRSYSEGMKTFRQWLSVAQDPNSNTRKVMALFKMDKYIRITKVDQIYKAKRAGVGFVQQSSKWLAPMDAHPTRIEGFLGRAVNIKHAGGHAYQVMDLTPDDEFVVGNTWGKKWGDEGCKTAPASVEQEIIDHSYSMVFLKTDMPFSNIKRGPRTITVKGSDFM